MKGNRKIVIYGVAAATLLGGLVVCALAPAILSAFGAFATGVGAITTAAMAGNAAEHFANKGQP